MRWACRFERVHFVLVQQSNIPPQEIHCGIPCCWEGRREIPIDVCRRTAAAACLEFRPTLPVGLRCDGVTVMTRLGAPNQRPLHRLPTSFTGRRGVGEAAAAAAATAAAAAMG
jgi:hypothetical protein